MVDAHLCTQCASCTWLGRIDRALHRIAKLAVRVFLGLVVLAGLLLPMALLVPGPWNDFRRQVLDPDGYAEPPLHGFNVTEDQRHEFLQNGFVVIPGVYSKPQIATLTPVLEEQLDQFGFSDFITECSRKLHGEFFRNTWTWRFWQGGPIGDIAHQLMGAPAHMITSEILEMEGTRPCIPGWHWDYLPYPMNLYNSDGIQAWLATAPVGGERGGGMQFVKGSHRMHTDNPCNPLDVYHKKFRLFEECYHLFDRNAATPKMEVGDVVFFSRHVVHRSDPWKLPNQHRFGFTLRMAEAEAVFKGSTMNCYPNHPVSLYPGQIADGQLFKDSHIFPPMRSGGALSREEIKQTGFGMDLRSFLTLTIQASTRPLVCMVLGAWGYDLNKPTDDFQPQDSGHHHRTEVFDSFEAFDSLPSKEEL